jgi:ATPase subunit of ABC transporter with duplicated ATPase domains
MIFYLKKNEEVNKHVSILSGGEKTRLPFVKIALWTLIDEVTNNIDFGTKEHITHIERISRSNDNNFS